MSVFEEDLVLALEQIADDIKNLHESIKEIAEAFKEARIIVLLEKK